MRKAVPFFLVLALLMVLCHRHTIERRSHFAEEEDILYLPRIGALKAMSLGHHELLASLIFIRAVVYFGGELTRTKRYTWLDNYLETIIQLDPHFELGYRWAGSAVLYNGKEITNEMVDKANHYLKLGAEHFPKNWQFPWMIGCNYMFEYQTDDRKQKLEWVRIGADWIRQAALLGSAPAWAANLAAQIMRREGQNEAAIHYLEEVYLTTSDERAKAEVRNRLLSLRSKAVVEGLERQASEFQKGWKTTVPYAHPDLYVILSDPPGRRMDLSWLGQDKILIEAQKSEEAMRHERDDSAGP